MKHHVVALLAIVSAIAVVPASASTSVIYQSSSYGSNGLNFGPDGTPGAPTAANYWEMGNTITFAGGASSYSIGQVDITLYGGGDVNYPIQLDIYSGSDPNTGTLLGTATAPAGYGENTTTFDFDHLSVPGTVTYILSLPEENGSYDSIYLYPIITADSAPVVGSGPNALWYGTPGSFVSDDTYAIADGATSNYLAAEFVATPEPSSMLLLATGLLGVTFIAYRKATA